MSIQKRESWLQRLYRRATRLTTAAPEPVAPDRPDEVSIDLAQVTSPRAPGLRSLEDWRDLVHQGRSVTLTWDGGHRRGTITTRGEVRLLFEESIWVWLDDQLPERDRPTAGQAMQMLVPGEDAMRLIPCQLVDEGRGSSLQLTVSGRLSRVQRRDDVRTRVDLPPVSAVRLDANGKPMGLLGLELVDLSAGGIRARVGEPVRGRRADPPGPAPGQRAAHDAGRRRARRRPGCPGQVLPDAGARAPADRPVRLPPGAGRAPARPGRRPRRLTSARQRPEGDGRPASRASWPGTEPLTFAWRTIWPTDV